MAFENIHTKYKGRRKVPPAIELAALIVAEGLDLDEAADLFQVSPSTIRQRLNQAGFGIDGTPIETVPKVDVLAELAMKGLAPQGEWVLESLCAQVDDEIFFSEKGGSTAAAKSVCRRCPVAAECLEYALANNERFGIWGGLSERERHHLMKNTPAA